MQYSYAGLWEKAYFLELIAILKKEWPLFQTKLGVEREEAVKWLDQVNRCRWDAHAAEAVPEEDLQFLKVCFRRLEEKLDLVQ